MELSLAYYNHPILRKKTECVNHIDDALRQLIYDMIETMHTMKGIGLAAPQVHHSISLFVTCVPVKNKNGLWESGKDRVFINPQILSMSEETQTFSEGCLSIPNLHMNVTRPAKITIQAVDLEGNLFEEIFTGLQATNFMHEYDHLNGILIIDYYSLEERKSLEQLFSTSIQSEKY
ncbi:peptide deformylase [Candidatus Protochlamydia sp. R18]|uniref:peptide deformylase n=1 Tax=Candidatus Protochlamydia sp. R18 TaxID=1353977 RepID=UPI0005A94D19|nr:peptide deformylase [Candidatus Protochlamydia sp. R18]